MPELLSDIQGQGLWDGWPEKEATELGWLKGTFDLCPNCCDPHAIFWKTHFA